MRVLCLSLIVGCSIQCLSLHAQTWTSADGIVAVTTPDASRFHAVDPPPAPFLVLWTADDASIKLGVLKLAVPAGARMRDKELAEGLAQESGGTVTELPRTVVKGYVLHNMVAKTPTQHITQAVHYSTHQAAVYKFMGVSGLGSQDEEVVKNFINSVIINAPTYPDFKPPRTIDYHWVSQMIGGTGMLLAIGLIVIRLLRKKTA